MVRLEGAYICDCWINIFRILIRRDCASISGVGVRLDLDCNSAHVLGKLLF